MKQKKRGLIYFLAFLLVLLLVVLGGIVWVIVTETGLAFLAEQAQ